MTRASVLDPNRCSEDALRPVLHRALHETRPRRRHDRPARLGLGHPAGTQPLGRRTPRGQAPPPPASRRQVLRTVRRGSQVRGPERREDAGSCTEGERRGGALGRLVRRECLDHVLIFGRRHLHRVLGAYAEHYNLARPHRSIDLRPPDPAPGPERTDGERIRRRDVLGGLIHEYERSAA
jgi:hypothetical protein